MFITCGDEEKPARFNIFQLLIMVLSHRILEQLPATRVEVPASSLFSLPEKVLQFGTGVLLRGLPDYFIDKANRQGIFNGRVVVVKSTTTGSADAFADQDGLFTHAIRGIENNTKVEETIINASISRVLSAASEWESVLQCAHQPEMTVIVSNTTEVGIQLLADDRIGEVPPRSFPGKLLAFLYERYQAFGGSPDSGMVIVPTELIVDNGKKLKAIVLELAALNNLEATFVSWLNEHNRFCTSLVDRIVPGKPDAAVVRQMETELGYEDSLLIVSEVYRLWAIQGDEKVKSVLTFAAADEGVVIAEDIEIYRELKLRMLNGTHTLSCGIAFLSGFATVKAAMDSEVLSDFVSELMVDEIAPAIPYPVDPDAAAAFAAKVLDRFRNPHIEHLWLAITAQFSAKLKMRVVPVLLEHYRKQTTVPQRMAAGFAAYLLFMKPTHEENGTFFGSNDGATYKITDDQSAFLADTWKLTELAEVVKAALSAEQLWETDLTLLPGFEAAVLKGLTAMSDNGVLSTLKNLDL